MDAELDGPGANSADRPRLPARMAGLRWLTVPRAAALAAVMSAVLYGVGYAFAAGFTARLGTTPEELGLGQPTLVIRWSILLLGSIGAAIPGWFILLPGLATIVVAVFAVHWFVTRRDAGSGARTSLWKSWWSANAKRRFLVRDWVAALCCVLPLLLVFSSSQPAPDTPLKPMEVTPFQEALALVLSVLLFSVAAFALARISHLLTWALTVLAVSYFALHLSFSHGIEEGDRLVSGAQPSFALSDVGMMADDASVRTVPSSAQLPSAGLILLGGSSGVSVFTDRTHLYRVSAAGLVIETALPTHVGASFFGTPRY